MDNVRVARDGVAGSAAISIDAREVYAESRLIEEVGRAAPVIAYDAAREPWAATRRFLHAACKRALDVLVAGTALLVMLPLFAFLALAIVIESPGPVFYRAERVGRHGRRLRMLKFRKMPADTADGLPLTTAEDRRLTRIGRLLARTKLDELPQMWHVLRGDMSLIGPRPEDPGFVAASADDYTEILQVRPGITGLSQLAFAEESEILCSDDPVKHYLDHIFPQKIGLDRLYATRSSLALDLKILFWTAATVLLRRQVAVHRRTARMGLRRR